MIRDHVPARPRDPDQSGFANLSRRKLLQVGAPAAGGLMLSLSLPLPGRHGEAAADEGFAPDAFIRIGSDGEIVLTMPYVEMGQGTYTSIPMLIAEELEVDLQQVRLEHAPANERLYANPMLGVQATGNSNAVRGAWRPLRQAAATARTMLVAAAAKRWGVDAKSCRAQDGEVIHPLSGRRLKYGGLAADAAKMPLPAGVILKAPDDFRLIGTPAKRLDAPAKVNGTAVYGIDARPPGVKIATLMQSPVFGGRVKSLDDTGAKAVKGVRQIIRLDDAVAVVADHMGAAKKGLAALKIEWDDGPQAGLTTADVARELEQATLGSGAVAQSIGDADKAMASAATRIEAVYQVPFLAHATMEPMNCTVHLRKDACEIWIGSQAMARIQAMAAKAAGLPPEKVVVHNHLIGGGFGRRLEADGAVRAVEIARHVDGPVKVVWTREEDIQHDMYRPYWVDRIAAGLDEQGRPVAWKNRFAGSSVVARWLPPGFKDGLDSDSTEGAIDLVYELPNLRVEYVRVEPPGHSDGVLAQRRSLAQCLRHRKLHRRDGSRRETRRGRLPAGAARQVAARPSGARSRCGKSRLGTGLAREKRPRRLAAVRLRQLSGARCRGRSVEGGHGSRSPRGLRRGLRHRRQPGHGAGADPERNYLRRHRRALWRDHAEKRPGRADELRYLSDAAHQRGAGH
jgi:isoquinoline 1-oxidoreductase beta subunit